MNSPECPSHPLRLRFTRPLYSSIPRMWTPPSIAPSKPVPARTWLPATCSGEIVTASSPTRSGISGVWPHTSKTSLQQRCSAAPKNGPSKPPRQPVSPANPKIADSLPAQHQRRAVCFCKPYSVPFASVTVDWQLVPLLACASDPKVQLDPPSPLSFCSLRHHRSEFLRSPRSRRAHRAHPQRVPSHRHTDRPPRQRLHLDLRPDRPPAWPHRGFRQPQEAASRRHPHLVFADRVRSLRRQLHHAALLPHRCRHRRSRLRSCRNQLAWRPLSAGQALPRPRPVHVVLASPRCAQLLLQWASSPGLRLACRNDLAPPSPAAPCPRPSPTAPTPPRRQPNLPGTSRSEFHVDHPAHPHPVVDHRFRRATDFQYVRHCHISSRVPQPRSRTFTRLVWDRKRRRVYHRRPNWLRPCWLSRRRCHPPPKRWPAAHRRPHLACRRAPRLFRRAPAGRLPSRPCYFPRADLLFAH